MANGQLTFLLKHIVPRIPTLKLGMIHNSSENAEDIDPDAAYEHELTEEHIELVYTRPLNI